MATVSVNNNQRGVTPQQDLGKKPNYSLALTSLTSLFFMMGFITCLNDILIPYMKVIFSLNYTQAMLINMCFFGAYFVMSIPSAKIVEKIGYKGGMILGFFTAALGAILFYPAADSQVYGLFLAALFILATGIVLLQVAGNPYVAVLGTPETASARLTLTQAFNSVGTFVAPFFGTYFILKNLPEVSETTAIAPSAVQVPYLGIAAVLVVIGLVLMALKLPKITPNDEEKIAEDSPQHVQGKTSALQYSHLIFGALAIFAYVGAEVAIGSFLVNYLGLDSVKGMSEHDAGNYVAFYWGGAMVGRFVGAVILNKVKANKVLIFNAAVAIALVLLTMIASGDVAMYAIIGVGLFNSIMFATIFTLAIAGLGKFTDQASGILCTAIVGGAVVPFLQGMLADGFGLRYAFILPVICYAYIAWYGYKGYKEKK